MNFYKRFVGDIQAKTGHLSLAEFGAYDRLLDHYYSTERGLPGDLDRCCGIARAMSKDDRKSVAFVLAEFFVLENGVYTQGRTEEMIAEAQPKIAAAKTNGAKGGRPKKNLEVTQEEPSGFPDGTQHEPDAIPSQNQNQYSLRSTSETGVSVAAALIGQLPAELPTKPADEQPTEPEKPGKTAKAKRVPAAPKPLPPTTETWNAYAVAYDDRYGAEPIRNASVSAMLANFIGRVPTEEGPQIAAYFVRHNGALYVNAMHPVNLLLRDAEKLRTEWITGRTGQPVNAETTYQRSMREKYERMSPAIAAKRPGTGPAINPMEELDELTQIT